MERPSPPWPPPGHLQTCIVTISTGKISYIALYVLFRTRAMTKFANSKICIAICKSFTNIALVTISDFKLTYLLSILTNLATFSTTLGTFRFFGVSVICALRLT